MRRKPAMPARDNLARLVPFPRDLAGVTHRAILARAMLLAAALGAITVSGLNRHTYPHNRRRLSHTRHAVD